MKVLLHAGASADLAEAADWHQARRPGLAGELIVEVDAGLLARACPAGPFSDKAVTAVARS